MVGNASVPPSPTNTYTPVWPNSFRWRKSANRPRGKATAFPIQIAFANVDGRQRFRAALAYQHVHPGMAKLFSLAKVGKPSSRESHGFSYPVRFLDDLNPVRSSIQKEHVN